MSITPCTTEKPSNPGIWMSRKTRSGFNVLIFRIASRPLWHVANDFNIVKCLKPQFEALDGQFFIINQYCTNAHAVFIPCNVAPA